MARREWPEVLRDPDDMELFILRLKDEVRRGVDTEDLYRVIGEHLESRGLPDPTLAERAEYLHAIMSYRGGFDEDTLE